MLSLQFQTDVASYQFLQLEKNQQSCLKGTGFSKLPISSTYYPVSYNSIKSSYINSKQIDFDIDRVEQKEMESW